MRVEDHLGNISYLEDVCETRSLIAIWRQQAVEAVKAAKQGGQ